MVKISTDSRNLDLASLSQSQVTLFRQKNGKNRRSLSRPRNNGDPNPMMAASSTAFSMNVTTSNKARQQAKSQLKSRPQKQRGGGLLDHLNSSSGVISPSH